MHIVQFHFGCGGDNSKFNLFVSFCMGVKRQKEREREKAEKRKKEREIATVGEIESGRRHFPK